MGGGGILHTGSDFDISTFMCRIVSTTSHVHRHRAHKRIHIKAPSTRFSKTAAAVVLDVIFPPVWIEFAMINLHA